MQSVVLASVVLGIIGTIPTGVLGYSIWLNRANHHSDILWGHIALSCTLVSFINVAMGASGATFCGVMPFVYAIAIMTQSLLTAKLAVCRHADLFLREPVSHSAVMLYALCTWLVSTVITIGFGKGSAAGMEDGVYCFPYPGTVLFPLVTSVVTAVACELVVSWNVYDQIREWWAAQDAEDKAKSTLPTTPSRDTKDPFPDVTAERDSGKRRLLLKQLKTRTILSNILPCARMLYLMTSLFGVSSHYSRGWPGVLLICDALHSIALPLQALLLIKRHRQTAFECRRPGDPEHLEGGEERKRSLSIQMTETGDVLTSSLSKEKWAKVKDRLRHQVDRDRLHIRLDDKNQPMLQCISLMTMFDNPKITDLALQVATERHCAQNVRFLLEEKKYEALFQDRRINDYQKRDAGKEIMARFFTVGKDDEVNISADMLAGFQAKWSATMIVPYKQDFQPAVGEVYSMIGDIPRLIERHPEARKVAVWMLQQQILSMDAIEDAASRDIRDELR